MGNSIAVIGAGVAGLTAARRLADIGLGCTVFEKARGPGGRISTRRSEGPSFDHGAPDFVCRHPRFAVQVREWLRRGLAAPWTPRTIDLRAGGGPEQRRPADKARRSEPRYVGVPGMSALTRDLAQGLQVVAGRRVVGLDPAVNGWQLALEGGAATAPFAAVVVAVPAPQAAALLDVSPRLQSVAKELRFDPTHAVLARFDRSLPLSFDDARIEGGPLARAVRNTSKPGRHLEEAWVLHSSPAWSREHQDDDPAAVTSALLDALARATRTRLPAPRSCQTHLWRLAHARSPLAEGALWDRALRIGVCGDWLRGRRVEAAFESGHALVEQMHTDLVREVSPWATHSTP